MNCTYVICGFSGVGKSSAVIRRPHSKVVDLESSEFSRLSETGERNPAFPGNYIDHLEELLSKGKGQYYLLSCHKEVRETLKARGIKYIIVMPTIDQKNNYLKRWIKRGSPIEFIISMNDRWDEMIKSCEEDDAPKIYLSEDEYMTGLTCL